MKTVGLALVGCGGFSRDRAQAALERTGMYRVVTCHDVDAIAAREAAERFGARRCEEFAEAIEADDVEAVAVMTPNPLHREQVEASLAAGKHVFVEKPMANSTADALAMGRAAERAGRVLMVGHHTRRLRPFRLLREAVTEGRLGRPVSAEAHFSHGGGKHLGAGAWRADPKRCPGLPLNVIGVHLVDVLTMLFGAPRTVAGVHARAVVETNEDCTATLLAYDPPVTATVMSHYCTPVVHTVRVVGTGGVAEVLDRGTVFVFRDEGGEVRREEHPDRRSLEEEFRVFARAVRDGEPVETDARAGTIAVAVVEAATVSARERRFVELDELLGESHD